jgi:DNA repair photolyase
MIQEFIGEFMFHPAPLELSGNTCSHNCCYCFANIRKGERILNLKSVIKQINKPDIKTFKDALIAEGYPICLSNKTDPFSTSNYIQTIAIAQQLSKIPNGIFIQTKGGKGIDEFLQALNHKKEIIFYITITTLNETIRKRIEPNAPPTDERFQLADKLKKLGYHVIIALNPVLEKWMPLTDLEIFMQKCRDIDINYICTEALHLNPREVDSFSEARKSQFEPDELEYSVNRKTFQDYVKKMIPILIKNGFETVKLGMPYKSKFYKPIREVFGHIFPNQYDIINYANEKGTGVYSFDDFYNVSVDNKPFFEREFKQVNAYLVKMNIHQWADDEFAKSVFSLKEVLRYIWNQNKLPASMQRNQAFRTIVGDGLKPINDANGNVQLYFDAGVYPTERIINVKTLKHEKVFERV